MSIRKKNAGRDEEAKLADDVTTRLVQKFFDMLETDYVRNVVIPVLEAEGFERIDFHHGPNEQGKDLVFFKPTSFDERELMVAVVKCDVLTKSASDKNGFPLILVQIQQAIKNEVRCWDGSSRLPDNVFLILADDPSHDVITSNPGFFRDLKQAGVRVVTGSAVARSLIKHRRDIAEQILQSTLDTSQFLRDNPTNIPLLSALSSSELVDIESIFTDLDASIGATTVSQALHLRSTSTTEFEIELSDWESVKSAIRRLENCIGSFLLVQISELERHHAEAAPDAELLWKGLKKKVQAVLRWCSPTDPEKIIWIGKLDDEFSALKQKKKSSKIQPSAVSHPFAATTSGKSFVVRSSSGDGANTDSRDLSDHLSEIIAIANRVVSKIDPARDIVRLSAELSLIFPKLQSVRELLSQRHAKLGLEGGDEQEIRALANREQYCEMLLERSDGLEDLAMRYRALVNYRISFVGDCLDDQLESMVKSLVQRYKSSAVEESREYSRQLLADTKSYLMSIEAILNQPALQGMLHVHESVVRDSARLGAPIWACWTLGLT
jgi:hypothetical protein